MKEQSTEEKVIEEYSTKIIDLLRRAENITNDPLIIISILVCLIPGFVISHTDNPESAFMLLGKITKAMYEQVANHLEVNGTIQIAKIKHEKPSPEHIH